MEKAANNLKNLNFESKSQNSNIKVIKQCPQLLFFFFFSLQYGYIWICSCIESFWNLKSTSQEKYQFNGIFIKQKNNLIHFILVQCFIFKPSETERFSDSFKRYRNGIEINHWTKMSLMRNAEFFRLSPSRSSRPEVFLVKGVLKISSKFTGEHPCRSVISIKLLCNFIETKLWHRCSPVNFLHIFRTSFSLNTSRWLLLPILDEHKYTVVPFCK